MANRKFEYGSGSYGYYYLNKVDGEWIKYVYWYPTEVLRNNAKARTKPPKGSKNFRNCNR